MNFQYDGGHRRANQKAGLRLRRGPTPFAGRANKLGSPTRSEKRHQRERSLGRVKHLLLVHVFFAQCDWSLKFIGQLQKSPRKSLHLFPSVLHRPSSIPRQPNSLSSFSVGDSTPMPARKNRGTRSPGGRFSSRRACLKSTPHRSESKAVQQLSVSSKWPFRCDAARAFTDGGENSFHRVALGRRKLEV